jgi:hypothetical protein
MKALTLSLCLLVQEMGQKHSNGNLHGFFWLLTQQIFKQTIQYHCTNIGFI